MSSPATTPPRTEGRTEQTGRKNWGTGRSSPRGSRPSQQQESVRIAPEAIHSGHRGISTRRPPTNPRSECEAACLISGMFPAGPPPSSSELPQISLGGGQLMTSDFTQIQLMTSRRVNSFRREKVPPYWQSCSLVAAGRAAKELSFDSDRPLAPALTTSVYTEVAPQSLSRRHLTKCERYARKVLPTGKGGLRRSTAGSAEGKWGMRKRSQKRPQHVSTELTRAKPKSDCLRMLSPLPESKNSRISAGALAVSASFSILFV